MRLHLFALDGAKSYGNFCLHGRFLFDKINTYESMKYFRLVYEVPINRMYNIVNFKYNIFISMKIGSI